MEQSEGESGLTIQNTIQNTIDVLRDTYEGIFPLIQAIDLAYATCIDPNQRRMLDMARGLLLNTRKGVGQMWDAAEALKGNQTVSEI